MKAVVIKSYGTFAVGLTEASEEELKRVADAGYEVLPRSNGYQIARCNSLNDALAICKELGAEVTIKK